MRLFSLPYEAVAGVPGVRFVDLRSPREFTDDHLPGAVNVPLFDDRQRAVIGTLYRQESVEAAYETGLSMVEQRLAGLLSEILGREIPAEVWRPRFRELAAQGAATGFQRQVEWERPDPPPAEPLVLHCWRGGMRSRSVVTLLHALGETRVVHLDGGYKAYRAWVRQRLEDFDPRTPLIVLRGPTGVGKTRLLAELERAAPGTTIDLEGFAQHRSSVLGDVGLLPVSQRAFDSAFVARLDRLGPPPWFVEGESRKVGDALIPQTFFAAMEHATQVRLEARLETRVEVLAADYLPTPEHLAELRQRLPFLEGRLGKKWTGQLSAWLDSGDWRRVAEVLLERYYDPRYGHHDRRRTWAGAFQAEDPDLVTKLLSFRAAVAARSATPAG